MATGQQWDKGLLLNVGLSLLTEGATAGVARGVGWLADNVNAIKQTLGNKIQAASGWAKEKLAAVGGLASEGWNRFKGWASDQIETARTRVRGALQARADRAILREAFERLAATEPGAKVMQRFNEHPLGLPEVVFEKTGSVAQYSDYPHRIYLDPRLRDLPPEIIAASLAEELDHATRRWGETSLHDEALAHKVRAEVWAELREKVDWSRVPDDPWVKELIADNDATLNATLQENRPNRALLEYLRPRYLGNPIFGSNKTESMRRFYEEDPEFWEKHGWKWSE